MGFPDDVSVALQLLPHIERMDVSKLLSTAWLLVRKRIKKTEMFAAVAQSNALRNKAQKELSSLQCFRCRGPYSIKDCTEIPRAKRLEIKVCGVRVKVEAILMNRIIDGIDVIIGMDVINEMGGVTIKEVEIGSLEMYTVPCLPIG